MMYDDDKEIMKEEGMVEKDVAYPRYIKNRFIVIETHDTDDGMCAQIADKEMGITKKFYEGDSLADGKITSVEPDGLVSYRPAMASVEPFSLPSEQEMYPIAGDRVSKGRLKKDEDLKKEHSRNKEAVLIIQIDDDMDQHAVY